MYGLVHRAIRDMVLAHHGPQVWEQIQRESGVGDDAFLAMQSYDDSIVLQLVEAASEVLGISQAECLDAFGQFWVSDTAAKHYGELLDSFGNGIWEFLGNLNSLHDRISSTFQGYDAPSFRLETTEEGALVALRKQPSRTHAICDRPAKRFGSALQYRDWDFHCFRRAQ